MTPPGSPSLDQALRKIEKQERAARWRAILYAAVPAALVAALIIYASRELAVTTAELRRVQQQVDSLRGTEASILDFLAQVTSQEQIRFLDPTVDWPAVRDEILALPAGKRKEAVLIAILYAWKELPFTLGGRSLSAGFDSPRFLQRVLADVGVTFTSSPGVPLSRSMMESLERTDDPKAGDLVFYRGQVGSFGLMILSPGNDERPGSGVGTLQATAPLRIIRLDHINTPVFPLQGYFRVPYPDE